MGIKNHPLRLIICLGLLTLIASMVGAGWVLSRSGAGHGSVAEPAPTEPALVCFGYVDAAGGVASLAPLVPGRVARVAVQENETVKAGSVLVQLEDRLARDRLRQAEANLAAAREQFALARKLPRQQQVKRAQQQAAIDAVGYRVKGARAILARKRGQAEKGTVSPTEADVAEDLLHELEALQQVVPIRAAGGNGQAHRAGAE
jgi:multidrug resistance efflux pump